MAAFQKPSKRRGSRRDVGFKVVLRLPEGATRDDAADYINAAVCVWAGSLRPPGGYDEHDAGDPFFSLDRDSVEVSELRRSRR